MKRYKFVSIPTEFVHQEVADIINSGKFDEFVESTGMDFVTFVPDQRGFMKMLFCEEDNQESRK